MTSGPQRPKAVFISRLAQHRTMTIPVDNGPSLLSLAIHLGRIKTSGADSEDVIYLAGRPVDALNVWLATARIDKGSVFRAIDRWGNVSRRTLHPKSVNDIVKHRATLLASTRRNTRRMGCDRAISLRLPIAASPCQKRWSSQGIVHCSRPQATTTAPTVEAAGHRDCWIAIECEASSVRDQHPKDRKPSHPSQHHSHDCRGQMKVWA